MADPLSPRAAPATGPREPECLCRGRYPFLAHHTPDHCGALAYVSGDPQAPACSVCWTPLAAPASPPPEPAPATVLHLFSNDTDSVIAATFEDALKVMAETLGLDDLDPEAWEQVEDSSLISIHCDAEGNPAEPGSDADVGVTTKTAAEWCARGRGFLWTTEY
jgi:hypothetical protein